MALRFLGFSTNIALGKPHKISAWRRIAIGTWPLVGDPSIYGLIEVDAGPALAHLEDLRKKTGSKITITHFIGKAIAQVFRKHPEINSLLRLGRLYPRKTIDVFFMIANDGGGRDLSGSVVRRADEKSITEIAEELAGAVKQVRGAQDPVYRRFKSIAGFFPGIFAKYLVSFAEFILYPLNLWTPLLGIPKDAFGGVMVTNVGSLGLEFAFGALVPYARTPMIVTVGALHEAPIAENGQVRVIQKLNLCFTVDHRVIDGIQAAQMAKTMKEFFVDPSLLGDSGA